MSYYQSNVLNLNTLTPEAKASEVALYNKTGRLSAPRLIGIGAELPTTIFGPNLHGRVMNKFGGSIEKLLTEFRPVRGIAAGQTPATGAKWNAALTVKTAEERLAEALKNIEELKTLVAAEAKEKIVTMMAPARLTASIVGMSSDKVTDEQFEAALVKAAVTDSEGALKVLVGLLKK